MLLSSLSRSFATLFTPPFLSLILKISLMTLVLFSVFVVGAVTFLVNLNLFGSAEWAFWGNLGMGVFAFICAWFLLPSLIPAVGAFFQEPIANTIEKEEYQGYVPPESERPALREFWEAVKFILWLLFLNLLIVPTIFLGIGAIAYFMLNSHLIGREFFETAAARHLGLPAAKRLRKDHRLSVFLGGSTILGLSLIPFVNLVSPFIGVAMMVHMFHQIDTKRVQVLPPLQG